MTSAEQTYRETTVPGPVAATEHRGVRERPGGLMPLSMGLAVVPCLILVCALGFASGGFLPGPPELTVIVFALGLATWALLAPRPIATLSTRSAVALAAMALYCAWALGSTLWSDSTVRGVLDFDRALLYLLALAAGGLLAPSPARMRWIVRAIALGGLVVCIAGLASRTAPDLFPTAPSLDPSRLSFPITYWNGLGFLAAVSLILCASIAADNRGVFSIRVLAAAGTPVLAATLILTLGKGPVVAALAGLVVLVLVGYGPGMVSALLATAPACAVAVVAALHADLLSSADPTAPAAATEGHHLLLVVGLAGAGAAATMILLRRLERRLPVRFDRRRVRWAQAAISAAVVAVALLGGAVAFAGDAVDEFVNDSGGTSGAVFHSDRLTKFANNGRVDAWRVAVDDFERYPATGSGAGTFQNVWEKHRPIPGDARDAHSLYLETLAELGGVGFVLLMTVLVAIGFGFVRRARGPDRTLYAGLVAAFVAWGLQAGVDWIWELPAVTAWLFFAGGAALARGPRPTARSWGRASRALAAVGALLLCVIPLRIAISQARLDSGLDSIAGGNCAAAVESSLGSLDAFGDRPEPYALIGYCDVRSGRPRLGAAMMAKAVSLDPKQWSYHYGYALARAAAGLDPSPQARRALALNPLDRWATAAVEAFTHGDSSSWPRQLGELRLPTIWGRSLQ